MNTISNFQVQYFGFAFSYVHFKNLLLKYKNPNLHLNEHNELRGIQKNKGNESSTITIIIMSFVHVC
jgi:hypothetical protein